jgi:hypothetical protein
MALSGVPSTHTNPSTDFTSGSESLGPAGVGGIEWDALNAEVMKEWNQLGDLYLPVDQSSPMSIAGGRAMARRLNMMFCMIHNIQFRMLKSEVQLTQSQSRVGFVSDRVEEAFRKVEKHVLGYDQQNQLSIQNT